MRDVAECGGGAGPHSLMIHSALFPPFVRESDRAGWPVTGGSRVLRLLTGSTVSLGYAQGRVGCWGVAAFCDGVARAVCQAGDDEGGLAGVAGRRC